MHECDFLPANGRAEYLRGGYAISCLDNRILGCIDFRGDLVRSGQMFIRHRGQIAKCVVYSGGRWAKQEIKGERGKLLFLSNLSELWCLIQKINYKNIIAQSTKKLMCYPFSFLGNNFYYLLRYEFVLTMSKGLSYLSYCIPSLF